VLTRSSRPRINKMNSLKDNEQKRACRPRYPAICWKGHADASQSPGRTSLSTKTERLTIEWHAHSQSECGGIPADGVCISTF
jgi:hypothetical protein